MLSGHMRCLLVLLPAPNQTHPIPVKASQSPAPNRHHCQCGQHQGRCCNEGTLQIVTPLEDTVSRVVAIISAAWRQSCVRRHTAAVPLRTAQGPWATHLGEPEKILHQQAGVGVINLHHRDLVFMGHQDVVILVEDGCQVEAPAEEGRQMPASPPAASFISGRVSLPGAEKMPCPRSQLLLNSPGQKRHMASTEAGTGTQHCQQDEPSQ